MDFKSILNEDSVDPNPRRFSSSHDSVSVRNDSVSGQTESLPGRKRSRSPSEAAMAPPEPSPKRIKAKKERAKEPPIWARVWTQQWQQLHGGKTNGYIVKQDHTASPHSTPTPAPAPVRTQQQIPVRPSTATSAITYAPPGRSRSAARPEPSYKNTEPLDELNKSVMDFIFREVVGNGLIFNPGPGTEIEIEAKIGTIIDKDRDARISRIPVLNECALSQHNDIPIAFKSSMTERQHQHMNNELNKQVQASMLKDANRQKMKYVHLREYDKFYMAPNTFFRSLPPLILQRVNAMRRKPRIRLTYDQKTGELKDSIVKIRWADMHVYSPRTEFDWRISISLEIKYDEDVTGLEPVQEAGRSNEGRNKDRLSYEHQGIKIDLTQVTGMGGKEHELEFELPGDVLKEEAGKMQNQEDNDVPGLIQNFVDDIRMATREFGRSVY